MGCRRPAETREGKRGHRGLEGRTGHCGLNGSLGGQEPQPRGPSPPRAQGQADRPRWHRPLPPLVSVACPLPEGAGRPLLEGSSLLTSLTHGGGGSQDIHPLGSASTPPLRDRTAGPQCQAQACPQTRGSRTGENGPQSSGKQTLSFPDYRKDTTRGQPGLGAATERPRPLWARHLPAQTCPLSWKLSALETRGILTVASPRRCHWSLTLPRRRGCIPGLRAGARAHPESPHENERPSPQPREPVCQETAHS